MSYISDFEHSRKTEEDYREYRMAAARENARERYEREHEFDDYDDYEDEE